MRRGVEAGAKNRPKISGIVRLGLSGQERLKGPTRVARFRARDWGCRQYRVINTIRWFIAI